MESDLVAKEKFVNMENIEVYFYVNNKNSSHIYHVSETVFFKYQFI